MYNFKDFNSTQNLLGMYLRFISAKSGWPVTGQRHVNSGIFISIK